MINKVTIKELMEISQKLIAGHPKAVVNMGDGLGDDLEGIEAYDTATWTKDGVKTEVNGTRGAVRPPFEWFYEISIHDQPYKHFLLTTEQTLVETYGKKVIPVNQAGAEKLLAWLKRL